jgi:hypothetical protein
MKKILLTLILAKVMFCAAVTAQSKLLGMNYQAVARDASGQPQANLSVLLKISMVSKTNGEQKYFSEVHEVKTDNLGLFNIVIGKGKDAVGNLVDVPWATDQIWLNIEMADNSRKQFNLVSSTQLMSVPYALHANTASAIVSGDNSGAPTEKNQSIYWTTGGNTATRPETHFLGTRDNKDLIFKTNDTTRVKLTKEGQMQVKSGVTGPKDDIASYPVTIEGSKQGIYIKVTGERSAANNFVTFADDENTWGAIEGQTLDELKNSWEYKHQIALFVLKGVSLAAQIAGEATEASGLTASGFGIGAAVGAVANGLALLTESGSLVLEGINYKTETIDKVGVTYSSGAGDYAEWLERKEGERDLNYGEIVGVKAGIVSLNTKEQVDHFMVVSKRPIVLGKIPAKGKEQNFEKIAFLGQVPVKVTGSVAVGDYIIPSGNNDGFGVAINPAKMKIGDYSRIVGVAWEAAKDAPLNYVNVAVGINANDLTNKVEELNQKVEQIMAYLEGKSPLNADSKMLTPEQIAAAKPQTTFQKLYTDEEFDKMVDDNAGTFKEMFARAKMQLEKSGYNLNAYPEVMAFLDNPTKTMKAIRRDPNYLTQWALIDAKIKSEK